MTSWVYNVLFFISFITHCASAVAQVRLVPWRNPQSWAPSHQDVQGLARTLDPIGERSLRSQIPGALRIPLGTQIHPSCLRAISTQISSAAERERRINQWFNRIVSVVVERCQSHYPELRPYIGEWISQLRRSVFTCSSSLPPAAGGGHVSAGINLYQDLNSSERQGLERESIVDLFSSPSRRNQPIIILANDFFASAVADFATSDASGGDVPGAQLESIHATIHEIFHATGANNSNDHNELASVGVHGHPGEELRLCDHSILDDRIYAVTSLCTQLSLSPERGGVADEFINRRINGCGLRRGCVDLFTSELPGYIDDLYLRSRGLPVSEAQALCRKIQETGICRQRLSVNREEIARLNPPLVEIGRQLQVRMQTLTPASPAQIPLNLLRLYPDLESGLRAMSSTPCFQSLMYWGQEGNLYFRSSEPSQYRRYIERGDSYAYNRPGDFREEFSSFSEHILGWQRQVVNRMNQCQVRTSPRRQDSIPGSKPRATRSTEDLAPQTLNNILEQLRQRLARAEQNEIYQAALGRSRGRAETRIPSAPTNPNEEPAQIILGSSLFRNYINTIRTYHPDSPEFNCSRDLLLHTVRSDSNQSQSPQTPISQVAE